MNFSCHEHKYYNAFLRIFDGPREGFLKTAFCFHQSGKQSHLKQGSNLKLGVFLDYVNCYISLYCTFVIRFLFPNFMIHLFFIDFVLYLLYCIFILYGKILHTDIYTECIFYKRMALASQFSNDL